MEIPSVMSVVGKHLVVGVDDDFRLRESLKSLVESAGYAAAVYSSAEEFLQSGAGELSGGLGPRKQAEVISLKARHLLARLIKHLDSARGATQPEFGGLH